MENHNIPLLTYQRKPYLEIVQTNIQNKKNTHIFVKLKNSQKLKEGIVFFFK